MALGELDNTLRTKVTTVVQARLGLVGTTASGTQETMRKLQVHLNDTNVDEEKNQEVSKEIDVSKCYTGEGPRKFPAVGFTRTCQELDLKP